MPSQSHWKPTIIIVIAIDKQGQGSDRCYWQWFAQERPTITDKWRRRRQLIQSPTRTISKGETHVSHRLKDRNVLYMSSRTHNRAVALTQRDYLWREYVHTPTHTYGDLIVVIVGIWEHSLNGNLHTHKLISLCQFNLTGDQVFHRCKPPTHSTSPFLIILNGASMYGLIVVGMACRYSL